MQASVEEAALATLFTLARQLVSLVNPAEILRGACHSAQSKIEADHERSRAAGIDVHLTKPVAGERLDAVLRDLLQAR